MSWLAENESKLAEQLTKRERAAEEKREKARQVLAEADASVLELVPYRGWLKWAVGGNSGFHVAFGHLGTPQPEEPFDERLAQIHAGVIASA